MTTFSFFLGNDKHFLLFAETACKTHLDSNEICTFQHRLCSSGKCLHLFFLLPFFVRNRLRNSNDKNVYSSRVYTERTINDVKRKDPMEKSKEPTLKLKDHAGSINYFQEIFPCATMSLGKIHEKINAQDPIGNVH